MKTIKTANIILAFVMLMGIALTSCIDDNMNNSPNAVNEAKVKTPDGVKALVIGMQVAFGDWYGGDRSRINSVWSWQMCAPSGLGRPQPVAWNTYVMTSDGPTDDNWKVCYRGIKIANDVINYAPQVNFGSTDEAVRSTFLGMAKFFKGFAFGELAATYGSIPIEVGSMTPAVFVNQQTAYEKAIALLDEAIAHFAKAGTIDRDLSYKGDGAKWTAAANTVKARYLAHMRKFTEALAAAKLGISASANNYTSHHSDNSTEYSPWGHWCNTEVGQPIRAEKSYIDMLKSEKGDTRLAEYFDASADADGAYWGYAAHVKANKYAVAVDTNESKLNMLPTMKKYSAYADPFTMVSYQENVLISAEAKMQTGDLAGAVADINIIRKAAGLPDFSGNSKDAITAEWLKQKSLALFLEGQVYHDLRRYGKMPEVVAGKNVRWIYPESEKNANPNVPADDDALVNYLLGK